MSQPAYESWRPPVDLPAVDLSDRRPGRDQARELLLTWVAACSICGSSDESDLVVDHEHVASDADGPVRGLLCGPCNTLEGQGAGGAFDAYRADPPARRLGLGLWYGSQTIWASAVGDQPALHAYLPEDSEWWGRHAEAGMGGYSDRAPWRWPDDLDRATAAMRRLKTTATNQEARGKRSAPWAVQLLRDLVVQPGLVIDNGDISHTLGCAPNQVPSVWSALSTAAGTSRGEPPLHRKWQGTHPTRYALRPSTCQLLDQAMARAKG